MKKRKFAEYVMKTLLRSYSKGTHTLLINSNPTETLVAAMLSPQCTDKQVNNATRILFRRFKSISDYAYAKPSTLRKYLKGVNYYKTKAMNIKRAAQIIERDYNGKIPDSIEELVKLPGVGRKVANVIMNEGFGRAEGIAIDTHCIIVSNRLGLARSNDPLKIERALMEELPRKYWGVASNLLIALGRDTCKARKKECYRCVLRKVCPSSSAP
ncbi:MAG: endonuclease III domain-containing protein [Candidatus Micrarchaeia archaeon]